MKQPKQLIKRNIAVDYEAGEKFKKTGYCAWYFGAPKYSSYRVIKTGDYLIGKLKSELQRQQVNEEKYAGHYTVHLLQDEIDEKGETIQRICSEQKGVGTQLPRIRPVCVDENGELTNKDNVRYPTRVIQDKLNIKFDFHSLRHTHATMLIDSGVSPKTVQQRLGHRNVATTLQVYVKATENMQEDAVDIFDKISSKLSTTGEHNET